RHDRGALLSCTTPGDGSNPRYDVHPHPATGAAVWAAGSRVCALYRECSSIRSKLPSAKQGNESLHLAKMRILHVLGKLDRGGVETWLVQVLRHIDRQKYQMDF